MTERATKEQQAAIRALMEPELGQIKALAEALSEKLDTGDEWTYSRGVGFALLDVARSFRKAVAALVAWEEAAPGATGHIHDTGEFFFRVETQEHADYAMRAMTALAARAASSALRYYEECYIGQMKGFKRRKGEGEGPSRAGESPAKHA